MQIYLELFARDKYTSSPLQNSITGLRAPLAGRVEVQRPVLCFVLFFIFFNFLFPTLAVLQRDVHRPACPSLRFGNFYFYVTRARVCIVIYIYFFLFLAS